jgi:hypothetical protein
MECMMKIKALILSAMLVVLGVTSVFAQARADQDYDRTDVVLGPEAGASLIQDLDAIKWQAIDNIIRRVQKGDPTVLKFVVYDVFLEVHKEIVIRTRKAVEADVNATTSYYDQVGGRTAIASFIGGLDNQDPKVRLRCIGFLGDWVDDIGEDMPRIAKAANDRLNSGIETREEVKYGLELLQLKVLRKIYLNKIFNGDEGLLATIDPEEFIVLVHGERFIRQIFCVPPEVLLRSIRLDPWWIEQQNTASYRVITNEDFRVDETEKQAIPNPLRNIKYLDFRRKLDPNTSVYRNFPTRDKSAYGYKDVAGYLDIVSLYDFRYFKYSEDAAKSQWPNEQALMRALFNGLSNDSLFVRENCARIIVRLTDGPVGTDKSGTTTEYEDADVHKNPRYEIRDSLGRVVSVKGYLSDVAKSAKYQKVAKQAWDEVKYSQYVDVHLGFEVNDRSRKLNAIDGVVTGRSLASFSSNPTMNPWGYSYNYRTDVADILRRMGLGRYVDTCDREMTTGTGTTMGGRYFVEDLFDPDAFREADRHNNIPLWHGRDEIKDEIFQRF